MLHLITEAGSDSQIYLNDEFPSYWQDDLRAKAVLETFFVCNYSADGKYIIEVGSMFGDLKRRLSILRNRIIAQFKKLF